MLKNYLYLALGGQTPIRDTMVAMNSDVEDGEISEEDNQKSRKQSSNKRGHKSSSRSNVHNRHSGITRDNDEAEEDDDDEEESRRRRKERGKKRKDKTERERNESSHYKDKSRRKKSRRRSSTDEEDGEKNKERSDNDEYSNGYRPNLLPDDEEALSGDIACNPNISGFVQEREDLISGKGETAPSSKDISLSVEETNKLRAKLGLAPLKVTGKEPNSKMETQKTRQKIIKIMQNLLI